jgi:ABC-type uncharacterized transport system substrate-binding protein
MNISRDKAFRWFAVTAVAALPWVSVAEAHPHAWIDLSVDVLFDQQGRAFALRETWLFDDFYTAYALEGMTRTGHGPPNEDQLKALLDDNLANLKEYNYFTAVTAGTAKVSLADVSDASSRFRSDQRLEMTFVVPFAEPVAVQKTGLTYSIFDPTYYIEVLHLETGEATRLIDAPPGCGSVLIKPNPTFEATSLAAALDYTQSGGNGLGALFAEKVTVRCQEPR